MCDAALVESNLALQPQAKRKNDASRQLAERFGYEWTGPELEIVARSDLTAARAAEMLGRTVEAVRAARVKVRRDPRWVRMAGMVRRG